MRREDLESLGAKRREIAQINAKMLALSDRRSRIERALLDELANLLNMAGTALLDSHYACHRSPIQHCVFIISMDEKNPDCIFCEGSLNR